MFAIMNTCAHECRKHMKLRSGQQADKPDTGRRSRLTRCQADKDVTGGSWGAEPTGASSRKATERWNVKRADLLRDCPRACCLLFLRLAASPKHLAYATQEAATTIALCLCQQPAVSPRNTVGGRCAAGVGPGLRCVAGSPLRARCVRVHCVRHGDADGSDERRQRRKPGTRYPKSQLGSRVRWYCSHVLYVRCSKSCTYLYACTEAHSSPQVK